METLRIKYTKTDYMKFLGHLELMKLFERIFRFEKLPLKFSEGFNPIPKLTFAAPLSVGYASQGEVMEVQLTQQVPLERIFGMKLPKGIQILDAQYVTCKKSLMAALDSAEYLIKLECSSNVEHLPIKAWVNAFLESDAITYEKKTKKGLTKAINILDQLKTLQVIYQNDNEVVLRGILQSGSMGSLNPETLYKTFASHYDFQEKVKDVSIERLKLLYLKGDALVDLYLLEDEA